MGGGLRGAPLLNDVAARAGVAVAAPVLLEGPQNARSGLVRHTTPAVTPCSANARAILDDFGHEAPDADEANVVLGRRVESR